MDRSKYISSDEMNFLKNNIKNQILDLKKQLSDESKFKTKEEIKNISVMREGDENWDE